MASADQPPVPPLQAKMPGLGLRAVSIVVPGVRRVVAQIHPYTRYWSEQNQAAVATPGPLLAVIGDSTALGIGASAPDRGYVGLLRRALTDRDGHQWKVVNLAQSGARSTDGIQRQLPILLDLLTSSRPPEHVICCVGTNDVVWSRDSRGPRKRLRTLIGRLPPSSMVGLVAGSSPRARVVNRAVRQAAGNAGLTAIDPWREPGPPAGVRLAEDRFHPNDIGYALMARPFARHLGAPPPTLPDSPTVPP